MKLWELLILVSLISGSINGMFAVGGGVVTTFVLMTLPGLLHLRILSPAQIASLVIIQGIVSNCSAAFSYVTSRLFSKSAVLSGGASALVLAIVGGYFSYKFAGSWLRLIFAVLTTLAAISMYIPRFSTRSPEVPLIDNTFSNILIRMTSLSTISFIGATLGIASNFLLIPIFMRMFRHDIKESVGTGLLVGIIIAFGGVLGRMISGVIPLDANSICMGASVIGAYVGSQIGVKMKARTTHWAATSIISLISLDTWLRVL